MIELSARNDKFGCSLELSHGEQGMGKKGELFAQSRLLNYCLPRSHRLPSRPVVADDGTWVDNSQMPAGSVIHKVARVEMVEMAQHRDGGDGCQ